MVVQDNDILKLNLSSIATEIKMPSMKLFEGFSAFEWQQIVERLNALYGSRNLW